jgi:hypothetical protein
VLPPEFGVSPTFNISDLKPYLGEEDELESRMTPIHEGEDDEDLTPLDTYNNPPLNVQGPITRARARQLNLEVRSFLNSSSYDYENRLLPNDYIVIRDHREGQGILEEGLGGVEDHQGRTSEEGGPNQLTSGLFLGFRSSLR